MNKTEKEVVLTQTEKRARSEEQRKAVHRQIILGMRQKNASIMRMSRNKVLRLQAKAVWINFMQSGGKLLQTDGSNFWFIKKEDLGVI